MVVKWTKETISIFCHANWASEGKGFIGFGGSTGFLAKEKESITINKTVENILTFICNRI